MEQLGEFDNFQFMLDYVKKSLKSGSRSNPTGNQNNDKSKAKAGNGTVATTEQA